MHNLITECVPTLVVPDLEERAAFRKLDKSEEAHAQKRNALPALNSVERGGTAEAPLPLPFNACAWNQQRGLFPAESARMLGEMDASLVFLSEMDNGMARTGQRHPTAEMAEMLQMEYAYGVEFIELGLGNTQERPWCRDDFNEKGFHGNALMAKTPLTQPFILPLSGAPIWFLNSKDQPRVGSRMAVGAKIETVAGPFVAISTHLESHGDIATRTQQMTDIFDLADSHFRDLPILIGGDLNTGNRTGGDYRLETLFDIGRERGFSAYSGKGHEMTTRKSLISGPEVTPMKLDWFFTRGLTATESTVIPALGHDGKPLSDHDAVTLTISALAG